MSGSVRGSRAACGALLGFGVLCIAETWAAPGTWTRQEVDWRAPGESRVKAIHYPQAVGPPALAVEQALPDRRVGRELVPPSKADRLQAIAPLAPSAGATGPVFALVIDSPPIDGFVPWIAVVASDEDSGELELDALHKSTVGGTSLRPSAQEADYAIGLLDTGAGATVLGNQSGIDLGLFSHNLLTSATITITGVTGSVDAHVSWPLGLYVDGLDAIDPQTLLFDTTGAVGQTNVAVAVGQTPLPGQPDLATAIGTPFTLSNGGPAGSPSAYAAVIDNDNPVSITRNSVDYTAPTVAFLDSQSPAVPEYPNLVPLELRPLGGISVQYQPCVDLFGACDSFGSPASPSIVLGIGAQSLYFVSSVDLYNGNQSAIDKDRFMLDTGAQITVVGNRIAARLALNPNAPDFLVEIQGVTGDVTMAPGFYIDRLEIPALGEWLSYTNVPVVLLDVASPEGGTLDGIIGMNLMLQLNLVVRGGGIVGMPDPSLEYEVRTSSALDLDRDGDGDVDMADFAWFQRCISGPDTPQLDPACEAALLDLDSDVDEADLDMFMACFSGPSMPAPPACLP